MVSGDKGRAMPRWRALPDELDPQVREFAEQLRRLVERSGLSIGAVADRTGYSKTSWERYLNGRLLPPRGATEALAEATGTNAGHLGTLWELAERAWSRAELRHDVTMEAVRVAEARAALGESGPPRQSAKAAEPSKAAEPAKASKPAKAAQAPGASPARERDPQATARTTTARTTALRSEGARQRNRPPERPRSARSSEVDVRDKAIPLDPDGRSRRPRRRTAVLFVIGAVGTCLVIVAAVLLLRDGPDGSKKTDLLPTPATPSGSIGTSGVPAGVKCTGGACTGKDPESMGCGGQRATSAGSATVGTAYLEIRYSKACAAAWARITQGAPGDTFRVSAATVTGSGRIQRGTDGHTTMVAVSAPGEARACAVLASGRRGCTAPHPAASEPVTEG